MMTCFLARSSDFLASHLVAWQPRSKDKSLFAYGCTGLYKMYYVLWCLTNYHRTNVNNMDENSFFHVLFAPNDFTKASETSLFNL